MPIGKSATVIAHFIPTTKKIIMETLNAKINFIINDLDSIKLDAKASVDNTRILGSRLDNLKIEIGNIKAIQSDIFKILVRLAQKSDVDILDIHQGRF